MTYAYSLTGFRPSGDYFVDITGGPVCGCPPNFSSTKSPVLKPAPGRISWNTVFLDTPRSSIVRRLHKRKYTDTFFSIVSFLVSSSRDDETIVKENRRCWGGLS